MASLSTKDRNQYLSKRCKCICPGAFCYVHDFILYHSISFSVYTGSHLGLCTVLPARFLHLLYLLQFSMQMSCY